MAYIYYFWVLLDMLTPAGALPAGNIQTLRHEPTQFAVPEGMGAFGWIPSMSWFCCVTWYLALPGIIGAKTVSLALLSFRLGTCIGTKLLP